MSSEQGMPRVGHFEKVSLEQFKKDMKEEFYDTFSDKRIKEIYDTIILPTRATVGSAGYDFRTPLGFDLEPDDSIKIPTGIRAIIKDGWFLGCVPRSGLGFKYEVRLWNTFGVIDSDYSTSKNEGHIFVKFRNGEKALSVTQGDRIFQAMLLPYGVTDDDETEGVRHGGFGSTSNKLECSL